MNPTAMTKAEEILAEILKTRIEKREELKESLKELINNKEIDYIEALQIIKASRLFDIHPYTLEGTSDDPACEIFEIYNDDREYKYETIYFTEIADWIDWSEGEVLEALDAAGIDDPYKDLYDYAMKYNRIGYIFNW